MHTYFTLRTCPLTRQRFGNRSVLFDLYVDVIRKATFKCNIGSCHVQAVRGTDFLLVDLPLLCLSSFKPHSDYLRESYVVLADGE